jgi:hypothetical protein
MKKTITNECDDKYQVMKEKYENNTNKRRGENRKIKDTIDR